MLNQLLRPVTAVLAASVLVLGLGVSAAAAPTPGGAHTVETGDTLSGIAERYGVSLSAVFALNGLDASSLIFPGDVIRLPGSSGGDSPPAEERSAARTYTVRSGDTLGRIAQASGISLDSLLALNGIDRSTIIYPDDVLVLSSGDTADSAPPSDPAPPASERSASRTYTVVPGDTLGRIAARHGVSLDSVLALNGLDLSSIIYPGDVLQLAASGSGGGAGSGGAGSEEAPGPQEPPGPGLRTGPNSTSRVILTYDDCPSSLQTYTEVVTWARSHNIGLVIAPTGNCITSFASRDGVDIAALARANGQYIINHSVGHRDLTTLSCEDGADELGAPGVVTNFGRPPYGALNSAAHCAYDQVGMSPWLWTVDTRDWTGKSQGEVVASAVQNAQPGGTVLMHLQSNGFSPSAIRAMQEGLAARGLQLCRAYPGTSPVDLPASLPC